MMKISIRLKLVIYVFVTMIIALSVFGAWMLKQEKKQWEDHQLDLTLDYASYTAPEIVKLYGRYIKGMEQKAPFEKEVKKLLQYNQDLIGFTVLNVNGSWMYDSKYFARFLSDSEIEEIGEVKREIDSESITSEKRNFRIITLKSGTKVLDVIAPVIHITGRHILSVRFLISYHSVEMIYDEVKRDYFITTLIALCFSLVLLVVISRKITGPVFILTSKVKKMRKGDFDARVEHPTNDEIGELSRAFNAMVTTLKNDRESIEKKNIELSETNIELKELQEQLVMSERLAAVGQLAAGISHEIDNPIGIILGYAEYIKSELGDDSPILDELENIINESKRCRRIVGGLLNFSRSAPAFNEQLDLNDIAREVTGAVSFQSLFKQIKIIEEYDHDIPVILLDRDKMKQVLINLLINAAQATGSEGEVSIRTEYIVTDEKKLVRLSVIDKGVGIPAESLKKIFDPFFSTKTRSKGTGLGLSICQKLIEEQNGKILVKSAPAEGTTVTISFRV